MFANNRFRKFLRRCVSIRRQIPGLLFNSVITRQFSIMFFQRHIKPPASLFCSWIVIHLIGVDMKTLLVNCSGPISFNFLTIHFAYKIDPINVWTLAYQMLCIPKRETMVNPFCSCIKGIYSDRSSISSRRTTSHLYNALMSNPSELLHWLVLIHDKSIFYYLTSWPGLGDMACTTLYFTDPVVAARQPIMMMIA